MKTATIIAMTIALILCVAVIFLGIKWVTTAMELKALRANTNTVEINEKAVSFLRIFIENVMMSKGPVSFEERLKLENSIREIKDQKILDQWQFFLQAKTPEEIQARAKDLLRLIMDKISLKTN